MVLSAQLQRLQRARAALEAVEARQNMQTASQRTELSQSLQKGIYHLDGGVENLLIALSQVSAPGSMAAIVGVSNIGWNSAALLGLDVGRIVVVQTPGQKAARVISSLIDGFQTVVVGDLEVVPQQQRALAARARKLQTTVLTTWAWQGVSSPFPYQGRRGGLSASAAVGEIYSKKVS